MVKQHQSSMFVSRPCRQVPEPRTLHHAAGFAFLVFRQPTTLDEAIAHCAKLPGQAEPMMPKTMAYYTEVVRAFGAYVWAGIRNDNGATCHFVPCDGLMTWLDGEIYSVNIMWQQKRAHANGFCSRAALQQEWMRASILSSTKHCLVAYRMGRWLTSILDVSTSVEAESLGAIKLRS